MSNAGEAETTERWRGLLNQQVQVPADKAWSAFRDFCGLKKWITTIKGCDNVEGEEGKIGCVRLVSGATFSRPGTEGNWAKEKLVLLDDEKKTLSYKMLDGTFGFSNYQAWVKVDPLDEHSSTITWNFEVDPVKGTTEEALAQRMTSGYGVGLKFLQEYFKA